MITEPLIVIAVCIVVYGIFSARLSNSIISAPMIFTLAGLAVGGAGLGIVEIDIDNHVLEGFGELTLGFLLFADAASTNSRKLAENTRIPRRLLLISLPLTILVGTVFAIWIFPDLAWQEAALIAAILAPTDAALGLAVVSSKHVPERIRQGILVESGLNDGLALPAVLLFAALSFSMMETEGQNLGYWLRFAVQQIFVGAFVGAGIGAVLGKLVHYADGKEWISHSFRNLTCIGVAILTLFCAHLAGGNGFIAAFVGGLAFGSFCSRRAGSLTNFVEEEGQLFSLIIFFFFGAVLLPAAFLHVTTLCFIYALLSLTIIRMAPTAISVAGLKLKWPTIGFIGWFGPRGLASILFLLIAVEDEEMGRLTEIERVIYITVFLSILLHGATAAPFSKWFGGSAAAKADSTGG